MDIFSDDLKVVDVSDSSTPTEVGRLAIGGFPASVFVSGRYAYVVDGASDDLQVIDVSDPGTPTPAGSLGLGSGVIPESLFVSGRYAYVVDSETKDLKMIDVADPTTPVLAGRLILGDYPWSVFVSGRYAYVVDDIGGNLKIIDISGAEVTSMIAHSLEAGSLQVRENLTAQGQLAVTGGVNIGAGGLFSDGNVGLSGTLAIANDIAPISSPADLVQLYAEDSAGSSELKVRDEAGNVTTLSPHNFSLVGEPSEPLAWSYYSENAHGAVNVDLMRAMRVLEEVSGEKLVHLDSDSPSETQMDGETSLRARVEALARENRELRSKNHRLEQDLERIKELLGLE